MWADVAREYELLTAAPMEAQTCISRNVMDLSGTRKIVKSGTVLCGPPAPSLAVPKNCILSGGETMQLAREQPEARSRTYSCIALQVAHTARHRV